MDWIPALSTSGLLVVAGWLSRNLIVTRLKASVQHEFNTEMERLRADLNAKAVEIAALQSGALSAAANRQSALFQRRIQAVDQIFTALSKMSGLLTVVILTSFFDFKQIPPDARAVAPIKEALDKIDQAIVLDEWPEAQLARPFLTPMAWALFHAIQAMALQSMTRWKMFLGGLPIDVLPNDLVHQLVTKAVPEFSEKLDSEGTKVHYLVVDALQDRLVLEVRRMLHGREDDAAGVAAAAEILQISHEMMAADARPAMSSSAPPAVQGTE